MARPTQLDVAIAAQEDAKKKLEADYLAKKQRIQDVIDVLKAMNSKTAAEVAAPAAVKERKPRGARKKRGLPTDTATTTSAPTTFAPEQGETGGLL